MPGVSSLLYAAAARAGIAAALRRRDAAPIFCFHNVVSDVLAGQHGDRSLHIGVSTFTRQLGWIARHFTVVPLTELAHRIRSGRRVRGIASLTFDDAYTGAIAHAVPALSRLGLPATVFIVTTAAERPRPYWWDVANGTTDERARLLIDFAGDGDRILEKSGRNDASEIPPELLPAPWNTLARNLTSDIVAGSHTLTHRNLSALTGGDCLQELASSRDVIFRHLGQPVTTCSYPYGMASPAVIQTAERAGYHAAVTLGFGRSRPGHHPLSLPRINVPAALADAALECWASGFRARQAPIRVGSGGLGTEPAGAPGEM